MSAQIVKFIKTSSGKRLIAHGGIFLVILLWGLSPIFTSDLLSYYSGGIYSFITSLISAVVLLLLCIPKLKLINRTYFLVAVPTGFFLALANLLQKIGLQYTTPTQYAFLENLSCVIVPILLFLFIRKKPGVLTVTASLLCLAGCFVLSGLDLSGGGVSFGIGEILCALAGILYGVNIAATGVYAKKMNAVVYLMIQMWVNVVVAGIVAIVLDKVEIGGAKIEPIAFSWNWKHLLALAVLVILVNTSGWVIRTVALKFISPSVVAIDMPFSSVVTGVVAICVGKDRLTPALLLGGVIILVAVILSSFDDIHENRQNQKIEQQNSGKEL